MFYLIFKNNKIKKILYTKHYVLYILVNIVLYSIFHKEYIYN